MKRRSFLGSILATGMAPVVVNAGVLMPVKKIIVPEGSVGRGLLTPVYEVSFIRPLEVYQNLPQHREEEISDHINRMIEEVTESKKIRNSNISGAFFREGVYYTDVLCTETAAARMRNGYHFVTSGC